MSNQLQTSAAQPGGAVQKQRLNVYTMMLIISFFAIVTATLLLFFELERWGGVKEKPWNTSAAKPAATSSLDPASIATPYGTEAIL